MRKRYATIMATLLIAALGFTAVTVAAADAPLRNGKGPQNAHPVAAGAASAALDVRASRRISIPYGIASPLPLGDGGNRVTVFGHGGCTDGETVVVSITITQTASGAEGNGETQQACNGEMQQWWLDAMTLSTGPAFVAGPARACGLATTFMGETETDTFFWCKDLELTWAAYLPIVVRPEG